MRLVALVVAAAVGLALAIWWRGAVGERSSAGEDSSLASYVGSQTCASCHAAEAAEWRHSQHARAMMEASDETVSGRFDGAQVTYGGVTSTFFRRDGKFYVRTDGVDGRLAEFEIAYTFGVEPLQQYLVELPGGRLQALSLAWDTRPAAAGGQRWFHLYPNDTVAAGDPLHWTGYLQNWNFMCADCHSTNVRKGYDLTSRQYNTTWSEISVGCEACHGPGSEHVTRAQEGRIGTGGSGLTALLTEREGVSWTFDAAAGVPVRSEPKTTDREIDACARCHSRRAQLTDDWKAGDPFENGFRQSLLETPLYHVDGQQRDEVYTYASFLQSRMHAKGVTCSDCHNPHTGKLRLSGNATCVQCHQNPRSDSPEHHFHPSSTAAAACTACHMPTTTYMVVDPRHDHSFRVPRPDLTMSLGVPNSCTMSCHVDKTAAWAAAAIQRRTGLPPQESPGFAHIFAAFDREAPEASGELWRIATDRQHPAVVRASALARLGISALTRPWPLEDMLRDASPLVRRSALGVLRTQDDVTRLRLGRAMLSDPVRTVRIEAASGLADLADRTLTGVDKDRFEQAFEELVAEQRFNGDRPEAQTNLGTAWMARDRIDAAVAAFREAIAIDRSFVPAHVNLADAYRVQGDERQAHDVLRQAVQSNPLSAAVRHALGLALVRQRRLPEAIQELERAVHLDPASQRYGYVYAVALYETGRLDDARRAVARLLVSWPDDENVRLLATQLGVSR